MNSGEPNKGRMIPVDETLKNREIELVAEVKKQEDESDDDSSPRGVLKNPVMGSDFDHSRSISRSSCGDEKSVDQRASILAGENNESHWKNFFDSVKWKSVRRFLTLQLLSGQENSLKYLRWKLGRNRSAKEAIDSGVLDVPKTWWSNFSFVGLSDATDNFTPETLENRVIELVAEVKKQEDESDEDSSPKGVLKIPVMGSDSDHGSNISKSSCGDEKTVDQRAPILEGENNGSHWRNFFDSVKWKSVRRFSAFKLLSGQENSLKYLRRKLGRNRSAKEAIDCGVLDVPKPWWRNFGFVELSTATDNFTPDKMIGKGGHAEVYKGCLSDGQLVAVKKIKKTEKNDEDKVGDFLSELGIIAHINHQNAVRLVGFCIDGGLYLVLQFAPHGSLASLLHDSTETLEWKIRFKVATGIAEGLRYLHCDCPRRIIHRDIKTSNILLTKDYEPQISDFGLAKWLPEKCFHGVVSPIEGTFGYMAPEFMHGVIHEKTDVFAFGVLLLELITGRRAVDSCRQSLVMWAKPLLENSNVKGLADPRLGDSYDMAEMKHAMFTALMCIHHLPNMRPNMKQVVQLMRGDNGGVEVKQKSMGGRAVIVDACDLEDYTCATYLKDLKRHMELVME